MFLFYPFSVGFFLLCVFGSLLSVSSSHWLGVWLGLEINLLGFIPLMIQGGWGQSVESAVKYFIVQALGSGFILLGGFFCGSGGVVWGVWGGMSFFLGCGLCLKLGVAPFHWWVPSVMGGIGWVGCGVLATWQKLAPFMLLLGVAGGFGLALLAFSFFSSVLGGLGGIGQVQVRLLMAYSSIAHLGWMVGMSCVSTVAGGFYYFFYFGLSFFVFVLLAGVQLGRFSQVSLVGMVFVLFGFLSLGGLPPLTGFLPKWVGLQVLGCCGLYLVLSGLVVGSLLSLYFYLSLVFLLFVSREKVYVGSYGAKLVNYFAFSWGGFCLGLPFYEGFYFVFG
uniref:NADH-ubiquinone oxidoreductase chain 2 n=1 Tax=Micrura ignea TaxID=328822 RepID=A0A0D5NSZ7_9BILA|nr:NADH dehydrogenase subunit 2 [Micrura ignea]AJY78587.1 NADH dehydrogenase subunit 2 [Micrura ignea]